MCSFTKKKTGSVFPAFCHATFHHALIKCCNVSRAGYSCSNLSWSGVKAMWPRMNQWQSLFSLSENLGIRISREGNYSREAIIWNIAHWKWYPKYFVFLSQEIKKFSHQRNWTWAYKVFQIWFLD